MRIPIFKHNDVEINYIMKGKGKPLVLVHGFGTKYQGWNFQISYFEKKMKVIALDNRGVGKSSRPNYHYTMDMFVEDIKALLDHLNIQDKIHLCGISLGGMIVQNFVLKYPEITKTLILCATSAYYHPGPLLESFKLIKELDLEERVEALLPFTYSRAFIRKLKSDQKLFDSIKEDTLCITPMKDPTHFQDYMNQANAMFTHDTREFLDKIRIPTLIFGANKDRIIPSPHQVFLHEKIPNSKLEILKSVGHAFIIEMPEKVNELMWNFIKENM
ncbi:MAG: alpha/beta fold hydrolase [Promethearchaeota archaeon]